MEYRKNHFVVGVDVGGTNTDAVLMRHGTVVACNKSPTTGDVTSGILNSMKNLMCYSDNGEGGKRGLPADIACVMIGTTHFINAVLLRSNELSKVAVLRLCGPACTLPPFSDFPDDLKALIYGHYARLEGGYEFDGQEIAPINTQQISEVCETLKSLNILDIVLTGVFSPINKQQEVEAAALIKKHIPAANITLSHELSFIGFLERENAGILNASLRKLAHHTVLSIQTAIHTILGLNCPLYFTQNDGTLIDSNTAEQYPVRTFASGATNSMRGAAFLSGKKEAIVVDIGGTSTDFGVLVAGFPRIASSVFEVGGVRTNFRMPDLYSIALGGGSIIDTQEMKVKKESVAYEITSKSLLFGGDTLTATDIGVANKQNKHSIGDPHKVHHLEQNLISKVVSHITSMIQEGIDSMKTSDTPVDVLLVGGGSFLAPTHLEGVLEIIKPPYYEVANAIGAAISQVSGTIDTVITYNNVEERKQKTEELKTQAIDKAVAAGGSRGTATINDITFVPVAYIPGNVERVRITAVADLSIISFTSDPADTTIAPTAHTTVIVPEIPTTTTPTSAPISSKAKTTEVGLLKIEPKIDETTNEWNLSEFDVDLIAVGCSILGAGGGGSTYIACVYAKQLLREGKRIRILAPSSLTANDYVIPCGGMGAPTVSDEKILTPDQLLSAFRAMERISATTAKAVLVAEVGGGNGVLPMLVAALADIPLVDADLMGRAFPELQMCSIFVKGGYPLAPLALADEKGNQMILSSLAGVKWGEKLMRAATIAMGCTAALSFAPLNGVQVRDACVLHSLSKAWLLGRAVHQAKQQKLDPVSQIVTHEKGKFLFKGKITDVRRFTTAGFSKGEISILGLDLYSGDEIQIEFQNENLCVKNRKGDIVATVPDIISIVESVTGATILTQDVRYGQRVSVIGLLSPPVFTDEKALLMVGPSAFGYSHSYCPVIGNRGEITSVFSIKQ